MPYAVVLYFDTPFQEAIHQIWDRLDNSGVKFKTDQRRFRPHITLAIFDEIDCDDYKSKIEKIAFSSNVTHLHLDHIGIFNKPDIVIFLAPPPGKELLALHKVIHDVLSNHTQGSWELYKPGNWVPHCTLANDLEISDLEQAIGICIEIPLPLSAKITQICIIAFDPIQQIFQVNL